jgi:mannosyltransferase OCH1-like enzyme
MSEHFPKLIWQTYKSTDQLPSECVGCIHSWTSLNPDWKYQFCSDQDMEDFFETFYPPAMMDLFRALPLGVMKADLWRYAVLYEFGGFYTDLDTICRSPLDEWLDTDGKGMHAACENDHPFFCQWSIASARRHPVLAHAIELIGERVAATGGIDERMPHYVHYYTGPALWTSAIQRYLGYQADPMAIFNNKKLWQEKDIILHPSYYFDGIKIRHLNASYHWRNTPSNYISWLEERKDILSKDPIAAQNDSR